LNIDKRDKLKDNPFSYKITKDGKAMVSWDNKQVKVLSEKETTKFLRKVHCKDEFEVQLELAKVTGNFKRGNEKNKK